MLLELIECSVGIGTGCNNMADHLLGAFDYLAGRRQSHPCNSRVKTSDNFRPQLGDSTLLLSALMLQPEVGIECLALHRMLHDGLGAEHSPLGEPGSGECGRSTDQ